MTGTDKGEASFDGGRAGGIPASGSSSAADGSNVAHASEASAAGSTAASASSESSGAAGSTAASASAASSGAAGSTAASAPSESVRLNKFIASSGLCSRREADGLIEAGRVTVDGAVACQGTKVTSASLVEVDGKPVSPKEEMIYIAYNKPLGITCTTDREDPDNIIDAIGLSDRIFPIGRLDKNSSGLILLTNDGDIVNSLLRAENNHEKEYEVRVVQTIKDPAGFKARMENGLPILGQITLPCEVEVTGPHTFTIILHQGLNRQIRRMCEHLGFKVEKLRRVRFMNIRLGELGYGKYRRLSSAEVAGLKGKKMKGV